MSSSITVDEVLKLARQLSPAEQRQLAARLAVPPETPTISLADLKGMWAGVEISEADISAARREMWRDFPREDIV